MMKEREAEELRKQQEAQAALEESKAAEAPEQAEPDRAGGSLQLGGEPEERPDRAFGQQSAIQPPGFALGPQFTFDNDQSSLSLRGGATAQQHQSQLLLRQFQSAGGQHQIGGGHGRQPSRFSFNETGGIKTGAGLQQPKNLGGFGAAAQQVPFYSGVQGPPPGLKTTGTPPVNGGSMFGQGHGFTAGLNYGAGSAGATMDSRTQQPGGVGGGAKREFTTSQMFPFSHTTSASSTPAPPGGYPFAGPADGSSNSGSVAGQKKSKKGKKHRHANTSSSGGDGSAPDARGAGGDPSILQARPYQNGVGAPGAGTGAFLGGQGPYAGAGYLRGW